MIKNERQYNATRKQIERLEQGLRSLLAQPAPTELEDVLFRQIQEDALRGQLVDLRTEVREYEDLRTGKQTSLELDSIDELPRALIAARISSGMTQNDLAKRVGIKEQMVQRYEANEYAAASFSRMREVAQALNVGIREQVLLPSAGASVPRLFQRLEQVGVDREFVKKRILPLPLLSELEAPSDRDSFPDADLAVRAAASVGRVFGFDPPEVFGSVPFTLESNAVGTARLKAAISTNEKRLTAYSIYARHLAKLVLHATRAMESRPIPADPADCRRAIRDAFGEIRYETALRFVWDLGIPVLPLNDPGAFHGALWRIQGRNVIVLKQRTNSPSRWLVNLLHELRHAGQDPDQEEMGVIEETEVLQAWKASSAEEEAVWFALDVALEGRAEDLAAECSRRSRGRAEQLKMVIPQVAHEARVEMGVLADYMAFRLAHDGTVDWWGAATNLQPAGADPLREARSVFWDRVDITALNRSDQELLMRALA